MHKLGFGPTRSVSVRGPAWRQPGLCESGVAGGNLLHAHPASGCHSGLGVDRPGPGPGGGGGGGPVWSAG